MTPRGLSAGTRWFGHRWTWDLWTFAFTAYKRVDQKITQSRALPEEARVHRRIQLIHYYPCLNWKLYSHHWSTRLEWIKTTCELGINSTGFLQRKKKSCSIRVMWLNQNAIALKNRTGNFEGVVLHTHTLCRSFHTPLGIQKYSHPTGIRDKVLSFSSIR